ncbi:DUF411 domain-containing protein [Thauera humireducens]|uniref:DUF411 domain-containing protein n=1 Tax=Thauera humireducens TaxID=1134435 RepID=UPI003C749DB1
MPDKYGSCHTAKVGSYSVEGHIPADDIRRLLSESPKAIGLATPGMPQGSPGMETSTPQPYETLLVGLDGSAAVLPDTDGRAGEHRLQERSAGQLTSHVGLSSLYGWFGAHRSLE